MDFLEYSDVSAEIKGAMIPGKVKFTDQNIIFKNNKTGKVDQIAASDIDLSNWQKLVGSWALRIFMKNGYLHRFSGFREAEQEKISKFFKNNYKQDMPEKELCLKGWNWGVARFQGAVLSFDVSNSTAFEIPLNNVSQCTPGKNEVTIEYHQNDDAPVNLVEMRFHIPSTELAGEDPVDAFHQQVMKKASVINVSGDAIAIFREIQCLTPRGRYDMKVFQSFFQLHGKTFDYKIPVSTVLRLFILPHKDGRQMFFVVSLDPPIKQGQTRYHFLTFLFSTDEDMNIELPFSEEELKEKYEGKLPKELSGPTYEVMGKVMKAIVNRKITVPGNFVGHSGTPAIGCSYKAAAGYMYPLERGFIYVHKPPIHIRYEEITSVNFARSGANTRSFDFEVELKSGVVHTFSSIEKEEYAKLWDFISSKKLRVKNSGKMSKQDYKDDDFGDSENEDEPDAYLARVKAEAEERDEDGDEDESTDEDFVPGEIPDEDVSAGSGTSEDSDAEKSDASAGSPKKEKKPKEIKEKKDKEDKPKREKKTVSEKPRKQRQKKEKDENKPKRAISAYMLWLNDTREKIKQENPGITVTEIAKKGGEMWKELKDKSEWEARAAKLKEEYHEAMREYRASGGGAASASPSAAKKEKEPVKRASKSKPAVVSPIKAISKEYISDDDSSSDEDAKKPAKKDEKTKSDGTPSKKKESSEEEEDSEEGSEDEPPAKKKAAEKKSDKKVKKDDKKSSKKDEDGDEDDDDFPEEPDESDQPTTSEDESGSD